MKRWISILLVFVMFFGMSIGAFGAKQERSVIEIVDGSTNKKMEVMGVNLLLGGKDVFTDVPSLLYDNRTLVPIRFVVENLGANIEWNQDTYEATITTGEKTIVLKIDSPTAYVNGEKIKLPDGVPPKLLGYQGNYRTMVPLRFISEELGMDVGWIGDTMTATVDYSKQSITDIRYDQSSAIPQVIIKTTGTVNPISMYLQGSKYGGQDRLVVDIPNANIDIKDSSIEDGNGVVNKYIGSNGIERIRGSLFETQPRNVSRIVFDLEMSRGYSVDFDEGKNEIKVTFLNSVKNIKVEDRNNVDAVVISTEEMPVYNIMDLGDRVVVDVLNAQLKFDQSEISVSSGGVSRIRTGVFTPDSNYDKDDKIVRVVLDLQDGQRFENMFIEHEENDIVIYMNDKPLKGFDYQKESMNQSRLKLALEDEGDYDIDYRSSENELTVKVPKNEIELIGTMLNISDNIVSSIEIDENRSSSYYYITMKLVEGTEYNDLSEDKEVIITFENNDIEASKYSGKIIILDAGHGGKDPGASDNGVKEKELALDTVNRLNKLLEDAGFATFLTRTDDTYIGLYERSDMANGLGADAFVSVHYNWHPDSKVKGVQVLYNGDDVTRDNKTFAKIVQEEMVKELGTIDRGIVHRPKLVVIRETKMPAILTEMAFISNKEEAALAATESYRQKCAQAIFNGIIRAFDQGILK